MQWRCRHRTIDLARPVIMGILNVTPDSFSDGGRYQHVEAAIARAAQMAAEGAAIIDVGGESTRPGSLGIDAATERERVLPVIAGIAAALDVAISIDTSKVEVMQAAAQAGACIVNDVAALRAPGAREWAAEAGVGVCLMHMQGEPRSMQADPRYHDVVSEVNAFLQHERARCIEAGIDPESIALLKHLDHLASSGAPLLVGVSRKSFVGQVLGRGVEERLYGGLGLAAWAVSRGARVLRTHDVGPTRDAIRMVTAVLEGRVN
jgi:dihydropteroate synthase